MQEQCSTIQAAFQAYLKERASLSQSFNYWNTYIFDLFPIIRDLTNSLRSGDWMLYISAVESASTLFFLYWENELQSMDTIIFTGLLSTEGQVSTPLWLLYEWWIRGECYQERQWSTFWSSTRTVLQLACQSKWGNNRSHQKEGCSSSMGNY